MASEPALISRMSYAYRFVKALLHSRVRAGMKNGQQTTTEDKLSICTYLERNAIDRPDGIALKCGDQEWTWSAFNAAANQYAYYFKSRGIKKGECVAVNLQNRPELLFAIMGITKIGAIAAMINNQQTGDVLTHSLAVVKPKLIVFGEECIGHATTIQSLLDRDYQDHLLYLPDDDKTPMPDGFRNLGLEVAELSTDNPPETQEITLGMPAYYIYTSGTTGLPKASIFTHLRAVRGGQFMGQMGLRLTPDDVFYCPLPFYHSNALILAFTSTLIGAGTLAIGRKFSVSGFW
ncbi:MAG: AMP-binding protein, partial [Pseudomonadota bacterium]